MITLMRWTVCVLLLIGSATLPYQCVAAPLLVLQTGHAKGIDAVAFSPDGRLLATGSYDKTIKIWDTATGLELRTLTGHSLEVNSVAFSPDGRTLASASNDKTVILWDVSTGQPRQTLTGHTGEVKSVAFSPDGHLLATCATDLTLRLWNAESGEPLKTLSQRHHYIAHVAFTPDGSGIISENDPPTAVATNWPTFAVWDVQTGQARPLTGLNEGSLWALSPNGKQIATVNGMNDLELFDVASQQIIRKVPVGGGLVTPPVGRVIDKSLTSLAFNRDGSLVAGGAGDGSLRVWNTATGTLVTTLVGHKGGLGSVAFSPDSRTLASGGADLRLWDVRAGRGLHNAASRAPIRAVSASADGKTLALGLGDGSVRLWSLITGREIKTDARTGGGYGDPVALSADGRTLAVVPQGGSAQIWDVAANRARAVLAGQPDRALALSPDGSRVAGVGSNKTVLIWDAATGKLLQTFTGPGFVNALAYSKDGAQIAAADQNDGVFVWNSATGQLNAHLPEPTNSSGKEGVLCAAFSPDGRQIAGGTSGGELKVWDVASSQVRLTLSDNDGLPNGTVRPVQSVAYSADGTMLVSGDYDHRLQTWDAQTGESRHLILGHTAGITGTQVLPGGAVVSSSDDGTARFWNGTTGQPLALLAPQAGGGWAAAAPDGHFDGTPDGFKSLHWVQGGTPIPLESFFEGFFTPHLIARVLLAAPLPTPPINFVQGVKTPPSVRIVSPTPGQTLAEQTVTVKVEATDQGGGVQDIQLFHNGVRVADAAKRLEVVTQSKTLTRSFVLALVPGANALHATAFSDERVETNAPAELTVSASVAPAASDLYILAAGIEAYKNPKFALTYCKSDAQEFAAQIARQGKSIFRAVHTQMLTDAQVTKGGLEDAFGKIAAQAKPTDVFIFYYSGHGDIPPDSDWYLICQDVVNLENITTNGLSAQRLKTLMVQVPALKKLLILDACNSGGALIAFQTKGFATEDAIAQLAHSAGVIVIAASLQAQSAQVIDALKHSVFTYALLQGLSGEADRPADGKVTVSKLNTYLNSELPILTKKYGGQAQYPTSYAVGQDFPLTAH